MATETRRPPLLVPGLKPVDPAFESHWVRPGGATVLAISPDDRLTVIDPDGGQPAEVTVLAPDGRDDAAALGAAAQAPATVLRALVRGRRVQRVPARRCTPVAWTRRRRWRSPSSARTRRRAPRRRSGADREAVVVVAAPGGRLVDGDAPASALIAEIRRATPRAAEEIELPAPLADPRLDFRVGAATASAYEVRAGEYIQVLDVRGRQCSDFLAFHAGKLQAGVERGPGLDGHPQPDGQRLPAAGPAGQVLRRRHGPADRGRPGHRRASRHASRWPARRSTTRTSATPGTSTAPTTSTPPSRPYRIDPRAGWPALNFFYNTGFDSDLMLIMDEPWSRPGDYVLLRAMTDLVCSSSACPDDIDPANGWEITDVHVRVYAPENRFSMAIAHRVTPEADAVLTKETAFHPSDLEAHQELRRVPRVLAAALLRQRGRRRRVLGLPREGGDHGPLPPAQVGDPRPRRRAADAVGGHPRHPPPRGRPGRLHRDLQRDGRDDRRRHRLPAGARQLPLRRRRRVRRRLAQGARRAARAPRLRQALHRPAPQRRRPGPGQPRHPHRDRLDAADPDGARRPQVVPLPGRADRRPQGHPRRGVPHRVLRRTGLRGLLPSRRRPGRLGRDLGGRASRAA